MALSELIESTGKSAETEQSNSGPLKGQFSLFLLVAIVLVFGLFISVPLFSTGFLLLHRRDRSFGNDLPGYTASHLTRN
jgi:hypothetical protein